MVERPIKKSERQAVDTSDAQQEVLETQSGSSEGSVESVTESTEERNTPRPVRGKDKSKGRGKGNQQDDSGLRQANPALARGPKPTKPKPPVIKNTQEATDEDSATEPGQETTGEG